jgi:hypothetical protein
VITGLHGAFIKCPRAPARSAITHRQEMWASPADEAWQTTEAPLQIGGQPLIYASSWPDLRRKFTEVSANRKARKREKLGFDVETPHVSERHLSRTHSGSNRSKHQQCKLAQHRLGLVAQTFSRYLIVAEAYTKTVVFLSHLFFVEDNVCSNFHFADLRVTVPWP